MGIDHKWFEDSTGAFCRLHADVGSNNVKVFDVPDYLSKISIPVHPKALLNKCAHVEVAVSGDALHQDDWMVIAPYRVDDDSGQKVYDVDPVITVMDSVTGEPASSGVVAFHQDFVDRTTVIDGYDHWSLPATVADLRNQLEAGGAPLEQGSQSILNALAHMHRKYEIDFR